MQIQLNEKDQELSQIDHEMGQMSGAQEQYNSIKNKLDIQTHELNLIRQRLLSTTFARQQDELDGLKTEIGKHLLNININRYMSIIGKSIIEKLNLLYVSFLVLIFLTLICYNYFFS